MSEKLDTLVDNYLKLQDKNVFQENIEEHEREIYVNAAKEKMKKEIYDEITGELREKAVLEAEHIINEKAGLKRISEFKKLMFDGFVVAIFVGLFVNQTTDIIGYYKGSITLNSIWPTVLIAFILIFICICFFAWRFISEFIKLLKKEKKDETD
ncbi:MAG: hypothetical protein SOU16_10960 [Faecalimonas sp.]|nr:hypothetical protein [Faecalimonas sp.]